MKNKVISLTIFSHLKTASYIYIYIYENIVPSEKISFNHLTEMLLVAELQEQLG